ncbi:MAG: hypothetical protein OXT67_08740 [Zetaproteobacteria bacterium]|nr:hypothetical protein [Zetaproteobacteria bacterium]
MDLMQIKKDELKTFSLEKLRELEVSVREEMAMSRMSIFADQKEKLKKKRALRKTLAQVLTFSGDARRRSK